MLAPGAAVVGDVRLGDDVSIWYGAVLRGDLAPVTVGARTNIQDGTVSTSPTTAPATIGADSSSATGPWCTPAGSRTPA